MIPPKDDLDRIMEVMEAAFDPVYGEAWNRRQVEDALLVGNCHYLLIDADCKIRVKDRPVAGFCLSRSGYCEEELLLFAVSPQYRRQGIGKCLLDLLAHDARARGAERLLLEMRKGNPAEALYRQFGFIPIGERRDYYRSADGGRLDAITFAADLVSSD